MDIAECLICQLQRSVLSLQYRLFPGLIRQYLMTGWLHWTTSIMEGEVLNSSWKTVCRRICLPSIWYFCKNYLMWILWCLIHLHGVPHSITLIKELLRSRVDEVQQWGHDHRIIWSLHVPHHSEAAGFWKQSAS